jgi:hypothetical protein
MKSTLNIIKTLKGAKKMKEFRKFKTKDISYLFQAPNGVPGDLTRTDESNVEPAMLIAQSSVFAQAYGIPVKYVAGGIAQFTGSEAATAFAGVLIRVAPSISNTIASDSVLSPTVPYPLVPQGLCVRGYVSVLCAVGTPARGGTVYVQVTADAVPVGSFRADGTDGGNAVALTAAQAEWASDGVDANGNAELRIAR